MYAPAYIYTQAMPVPHRIVFFLVQSMFKQLEGGYQVLSRNIVVCRMYRSAVRVWEALYSLFIWLVCVRCMRQHTSIRKQCQCPIAQCFHPRNQGQNNPWDSNKWSAETLWFAVCIEVRSGFERCFILCLPGLFALDVCASIHLYASNASAPLHSVLFGTIEV